MIKYNILDSCSEIDENKFRTENWYLMNWGMGDAIDATLFLELNHLCHTKFFVDQVCLMP